MKLSDFVEGINILVPYLDDQYPLAAEHDQFFIGPTQRPLPPELVQRMFDLGWFQEGQENDDVVESTYDPEVSWSAFV